MTDGSQRVELSREASQVIIPICLRALARAAKDAKKQPRPVSSDDDAPPDHDT